MDRSRTIMNIFMTEPTAGGKIGKCPIYGDTVELIELIKELPPNSKIVDSNEFYTRYEKDLLTFVKKKSSERVVDYSRLPTSSGGTMSRTEELDNLKNYLI